MSKIIRNTATGAAARMYRWNGYILRTPITLHLLPDQKKIYQIGDESTRGADGYLHGGFRGGNTYYTTVEQVGY